MLQRFEFECAAVQTQSRETRLAIGSEEPISFREVKSALISFHPFSLPLIFPHGHCKSLPGQARDIDYVVAQPMTGDVSASYY
jgi:hypothetical protein